MNFCSTSLSVEKSYSGMVSRLTLGRPESALNSSYCTPPGPIDGATTTDGYDRRCHFNFPIAGVHADLDNAAKLPPRVQTAFIFLVYVMASKKFWSG